MMADDDPDWFRPKRYGYGAGLPLKWQGWALLASHVALLVGIGAMLRDHPVALVSVVFTVALVPMPLYAAHTEGGWRWKCFRRRMSSSSMTSAARPWFLT